MLTEREALTLLVTRLPHLTFGPEKEDVLDCLHARLATDDGALKFWKLEDGGFHINGVNHRGECPGGLDLVWQAVRAYYEETPATVLPKRARHAAGKSIKVALRWAKRRPGAERLSLVIECVRMSGGRPVFDRLPGVPEVRYARPDAEH